METVATSYTHARDDVRPSNGHAYTQARPVDLGRVC